MFSSLIRNAAVISLLSGLASCSIFTAGTKQRAEHPLRDVQKMIDPKTGKEVVFVWMQHLSTEEGYAQIRNYLDGLKAEGYVTFCEAVMPVPFHIDTVGEVTMRQLTETDYTFSPDDSLRLDTLRRKCRRMLGFMIGERGYADPGNESLKTKDKGKGYVPQSEERLGLTTDRDIWADYSLQDIVEVCENKYGEIPLTAYDWQTGLYKKYTPEQRSPQQMRSYFKIFARNDYLVKRVAESPHPKIAVVYGSGHSFGVIYYLKKTHGFRIDKRYKAA